MLDRPGLGLFGWSLEGEDNRDHLARTLPTVLWLAFAGCIASAALALANSHPLTAAGILGAAVLIGGALLLTRGGRLRLASFVFLGAGLLLATYLLRVGPGLQDVGVLVYPVILIVGGILLEGPAFGVLFVLCLASLALGAYGPAIGGETRAARAVGSDLAYVMIILVVAAAAVWLLASAMRRSLREARTSERALRASEASFTKAFRSSPVIMVITSLDEARILDVNDSFVAATGYTHEQVVGSPTRDVGMFVDVLEADAIRAAMLARGAVRGVPLRLRSRSGATLFTLVSGEAIELDGRNCGLYAVTDVTALRRAEDALAAKNAELERFSYTVSHDLKSPLITVRSFVGFLEQDALSGNLERLRSDVARITAATAKMQRMLDELLELSRIGSVASAASEVRFSDIALEAVALVRGRLDQAGASVEVAPGLPMVRADRGRLLVALQNLLDNAVKFGGKTERPRIEVGARQEGGSSVFYVRDNGIGIDPRHQLRVFELFEKLDPASEGTGLGLALVKRIIESHDGTIWAESLGEGLGTTFCFTLGDGGRARARAAASAAFEASREAGSASG